MVEGRIGAAALDAAAVVEEGYLEGLGGGIDQGESLGRRLWPRGFSLLRVG